MYVYVYVILYMLYYHMNMHIYSEPSFSDFPLPLFQTHSTESFNLIPILNT